VVALRLVTSVHGRDLDALQAAAAGVDTGLMRINVPPTGVDFYTSVRTITFAPHDGQWTTT
jgi:hypothetical protein